MSAGRRRREAVGWVLFTLCALVYTIANVRDGDWLSLVGSLLFLLACLFFIFKPRRERSSDGTQDTE